MTDDLVERLRLIGERQQQCTACYKLIDTADEAADRIEKLESVTKDDAKWLAAYHKWCEMHGCAPSSSDLISARKALDAE